MSNNETTTTPIYYKEGTSDFNNKTPLYQPIRWTMVALFWLNWFMEAGAAVGVGKSPNVFAVFITFWIARYFVRENFKKNIDMSTINKILSTIGIYIGTFIIKSAVLLGILMMIA